ncbi:MAG: 6-phosphogluconolactonase [Pseudomonadota bacterium]
MKFVEYPDREMMMIDVANVLAGELNSCLMRHEWASFALPGGSTPGPMFDALCAADLDWDRVHVMLADERWVPETSDRSNTKLIRERLLVERAAAARYVSIHAAADRPEDAIDALSDDLRAELPLSVLVLGMGDDMHVASLIPGADGLHHAMTTDDVLAPIRVPGSDEARITMTASVLKGAMATHLLITGAAKRAALERAQTLAPADAPVRVILGDATVHWAE